jgi:hypothetical protein
MDCAIFVMLKLQVSLSFPAYDVNATLEVPSSCHPHVIFFVERNLHQVQVFDVSSGIAVSEVFGVDFVVKMSKRFVCVIHVLFPRPISNYTYHELH